MAMEINHFSHTEHPLILRKESHKNKSSDEAIVCYGCQIPIADCDDDDDDDEYLEGYYECATCNLFLHKQCAEAPTQINYPMHTQHPLNLHSQGPPYYEYATCTVCRRNEWEWFTYSCSYCEFNIDIICALKTDRKFEHKSHPHSLTSQLREALFFCDACGIEGKDLSYLCTTCPFWIHKKCGLLPTTNKFSHHNHDLQLAYSFPHSYRQFISDCDICRKKLHPKYWLYYCANCRYFVHLKCATTPQLEEQRDEQGEEDLFKFPVDRPALVRSQFLKKMSLLQEDADFDDGQGETMIDHWSHSCNLQLILSDDDGQSKNDDELKTTANIVNYDGTFCAACLQTITHPFFHCSEHSFFLHRYCALLPLELQHPAHSKSDHPLTISNSLNVFNYFFCRICFQRHSGFCYACETCNVYICITCASLPTKIRHEIHQHPLVFGTVSDCLCVACNQWFDGVAYKCVIQSCSFNLNYKCATMLPRTLTHYYDEHPLYLTKPPIEDHPNDYYCEICEEDIHPKFWFYYCHKCSYSFHINCLYPIDPFQNVKFGDMYEMENHPHQLTLIRNGGIDSPCLCGSCGNDEKGYPVLDCSECGIKICEWCAGNKNCKSI